MFFNKGWGKSFKMPVPVMPGEDPNNITEAGWRMSPWEVALRDELSKHAHLDTQWDLKKMREKCESYFYKGINKYTEDERIKMQGSPVQAQVIVEEFVDMIMGGMAAGCYDKAWINEANFSLVFFEATKQTMKGSKLFTRTLGPMLHKHVEDAIFKYKEEERLQKVMWDAVSMSGLTDAYQKKASKHLQTAFDDAHLSAQYGSTQGVTLEFGMLQDFVKGWMAEFVSRSWDVLQNGVGSGQEAWVPWVTALFQNLCGPDLACLPHELVAQAGENLPPASWTFVAEAAYVIFAEAAMQSQQGNPFKKRKVG